MRCFFYYQTAVSVLKADLNAVYEARGGLNIEQN